MKPTVVVQTLLVALMLTACGGGVPPVQTPSPARAVASEPPEAMVSIWSAVGSVSTGMGADAVYVAVGQRGEDGRFEQRLHRIDRASRRTTSRVVGADFELMRVDPILVNVWDGERARWLGTRIMRLSETLEPLWRSEPMNMMIPQYATGPLVLVEQVQMGEYVGLDPEDGDVVFRLRGDPDGIMNYAVEAESFIAIPTEERVILTDRATGEISGVVDGQLGEWEVIGDRLVVASPDRLIAYDGRGQQAWTRTGDFPNTPARTILSWSPDTPPGHADALLVWERGRGLVAIDEAGAERWVYPVVDESAWGQVFQIGERVRIGAERGVLLDARSGEVLFACPTACDIRRHDDHGVLVEHAGPDGSPVLALYGFDGERRWVYAPGAVDEHGEPIAPSVALLPGVVATCSPGAPVTFLDRDGGSVLSTHPMPRGPELVDAGSPRCWVEARDGLVLAIDDQGAALFGPARRDEDLEAARADSPGQGDSLPPIAPAGEPAVRPLYRLATLVPPADGALPEVYLEGRAAYRAAREAFEAGRFEEAAAGFIAAYRAFFAADRGDVQQLGLECCYDARVSVDHAGGGEVSETLLATLTDADERCRRIFTNAPPPSRPF